MPDEVRNDPTITAPEELPLDDRPKAESLEAGTALCLSGGG